QDIRPEEARPPTSTTTLSEILQDVIVYVEVRTGNDNRSAGVKSIIAKMGIKVNDRLLRNTTHVVFKDGLMSTYKRAQKWNIPIVSILWIEACKVQRRLCEPAKFPISNLHLYEYPEIYGKIPRVRCMQPDSELNRRPRKRQGTPDQENRGRAGAAGAAATPTSTPNPLSQRKHLLDDGVPESPATQLLNRMNSGLFTPLQATNRQFDVDTPIETDPGGRGDSTIEKPAAQKSLDFDKENPTKRSRSSSVSTASPHVSFTSVLTTRRSSSAHTIMTTELAAGLVQSEPRVTRRRSMLALSKTVEVEESTPPQTPTIAAQSAEQRKRRRSSFQVAALSIATDSPVQSEKRKSLRRSTSDISSMELSTPKLLLKKPSFQSIAEEPLNNNKTNHVLESMDMSSVSDQLAPKLDRRRTLYELIAMDISEKDEENINPYLGKDWRINVTPKTSADNCSTRKTSYISFGEHTPVPVFSSTRLPGSKGDTASTNRRRSLFNVDMELATERINEMNSTSEKRSLALANDAELGQCRPFAPLQAVATKPPPTSEESSSTEPKMRRLFTPNDEVVVSPPKSTKKSRKSSSNESSTSSNGTLNRRRTLATPRPTAAVGPTLQNGCADNESPVSSETINTSTVETPRNSNAAPKRYIIVNTLVHTNMHREQVQVIHKVVRKLRGMRIDPMVTKRTTHLVSLEPRRTLNLLRGLMRGVWIVDYKWILDSMRAGKWLNEESYELTTFSRAIEICRTERQAFGSTYRCELFRYMETFYVSSLCRPITFNNIKELLLLGGAKLTENRYKAKFIIGDKRRAEDDRIYLMPNWVLDSITAMQIQKFGKYLMKSAIVTPYGIRYENPRDADGTHHIHARTCYRDPVLVINK
ncbi:hypothetical protein KR222_011641, partial [Zaprionus bogoriensis]